MDRLWLEVGANMRDGNEFDWIEGLCKKIKESQDRGEPFYFDTLEIDYSHFTDCENVISFEDIYAAPQA